MSAKPLLKLYKFIGCPFCERVEIAAAEKKLNIESVVVSRDIPKWYTDLNPNETVPVLQVGNKILVESGDIVKYIDNITEPKGALMGSTPFQKYRIEFLSSQVGYFISAAIDLFSDPYNEEKRKSLEENIVHLDNLVKENQEKGGDYFCDDKFTFADIMLLPSLNQLKITLSYYCAFDIFEKAPHLKKIWSAGLVRASVKQVTETPHEYILAYQHLVPDDSQLVKAQGGMVLYGNKFCPFVDRVKVACALRKINVYHVEIDLSNIPSWYKYVNPRETVPALLTGDGQFVHESMLIVNYLDRTAPAAAGAHPLVPLEDADKEYAVSAFIQTVGDFISAIYTLSANPTSTEIKQRLVNAIEKLQAQFNAKVFGDGPFFGGSTMNVCDVALLPFLVRLKANTPELTNGYDAFKQFPFLEENLKACLNTEAKNVFFTMEEYLVLSKRYAERLKKK